jgi:hypothetical protein
MSDLSPLSAPKRTSAGRSPTTSWKRPAASRSRSAIARSPEGRIFTFRGEVARIIPCGMSRACRPASARWRLLPQARIELCSLDAGWDQVGAATAAHFSAAARTQRSTERCEPGSILSLHGVVFAFFAPGPAAHRRTDAMPGPGHEIVGSSRLRDQSI